MRKRDITPEGKTWAGDISEVPASFEEPLRRMVKELNWTGGGELEMVRDARNKLWLLEMNPRFPAWVHGATLAGHNLPALLIQGATGQKAQKCEAQAQEFTRVVLEVPVRPEYPLPPLPEPYAGAIGHSMKHPSGLTSLAERLHKADIELIEIEADDGAPKACRRCRKPISPIWKRWSSARSKRRNSSTWRRRPKACSSARRSGPTASAPTKCRW
jgi:hypothetical protein